MLTYGWVTLYAFCAGFLLDLAFGDPLVRLHPIRLLGLGIAQTETLLRRVFPKTPQGELWAGGVLAVLVPGVCFAAVFLMLRAFFRASPPLALLAQSLLNWQLLSVKSLRQAAEAVYRPLAAGDLEEARRAVSAIVGRDTEWLDAAGITRAAVETVAENTVDGAVAPLLFLALGGAPLGLLYKAVNTLDSMVGYKNETYLYFGRAAAKLDDALNFLPARLCGALMVAAAWLLRLNHKNAARIFLRDRRCHASPNSAHAEAACAGALGVQLAGDACYFGELYRKPFIGDARRDIEPRDILRAGQLLYLTAGLCFLLCAGIRVVILLLVWR